MKWMLAAAGVAAALAAGPALAQNFGPPELIEAAKKEGKLVFYTANLAEVEQEVIKAFNKRFPEIKVEMVRASGGQLITRIKTEMAAGKLIADVIDHSDRGLIKGLEDQLMDYAPPNAADYLESSRVSPKIWPRATLGWAIAYNPAIVQDPPKTWGELLDPKYKGKQIGTVIAPSGGTTWTRSMFERKVLGEDYWKKFAAQDPVLYVSNAPLSDAIVRGEVSMGPLLYNIAFLKNKEGAPIEATFPPEGVPIIPFADAIPKTAQHPNAAKLFLNWCLSEEGQAFMIKELGQLTSLKNPPAYPKGWDPKTAKVWLPDFGEFEKLREPWIDEWNKTFNYRQ
jgi:iron(III) transport system substrate-binding protein